MNSISQTLLSPVYPAIPFNLGLALFLVILFLSNYLPTLGKKLIIFLTSLAFLALMTSIEYLLYFLGVALAVYYLSYLIQDKPYKKQIAYFTSILLTVFFFLMMSLPSWETPWTGSYVHSFGIAYSLMRLVAFVLDVGKEFKVQKNPLDFLLFQFFMPTFFKGPIEKFQEFRNYFQLPYRPTFDIAIPVFLRFSGAAIKGFLAFHFLNIDWQTFFNTPQLYSYNSLIWGFYARAISFYFIVSAANDFSIGGCTLCGVPLHENYDYPYFRRNLADFWRTWHITVFRFLRDYLYIPLGGNRRHHLLNLFIVFMAIALWHVVSVAFVIWGAWHALGMCVLVGWQKLWKRVESTNQLTLLKSLHLKSKSYPRFMQVISTLITFHFVAIGWLPFWGGHPQGINMFLRLISGNHWKLFEWEP